MFSKVYKMYSISNANDAGNASVACAVNTDDAACDVNADGAANVTGW